MPADLISRRDTLTLGAAVVGAEAARGAAVNVAAGGATGSATERATESAPALAALPPVDRAFLRLREGLVHYRSAGTRDRNHGVPLYLAHAGPGSSRAFEGLLPIFGRDRFAFAPDMLGNGDSAAPASDTVDMGYYVDCAIRTMDALRIEQVDFYGSHTGAQIGCQLAVTHPRRVRRLVLDGIPLFPEDFKQQLLARYAPRIEPDDHGGQLSWAWNFVRDQSLFWPYFDRRPETRLANGIGQPAQLHARVTDVLKALGTYHIAYRAAFAQDLRPLLPQLRGPVLIMASEQDPLSQYLDAAAALAPHAQKRLWPRTTGLAELSETVVAFFRS